MDIFQDNKLVVVGVCLFLVVAFLYTRNERLWEDHGENQFGEPRNAISAYNCALCAAENCPCAPPRRYVTTETLSVPVASFNPNKQAPNSDMIRQNKQEAKEAQRRAKTRQRCYERNCGACGNDYPYGQFITGQCPSARYIP